MESGKERLQRGMKINDIQIGNRFRKDLGNIEDLARSIERFGLFHPVVINENNELICGARRVKAYEFLARDDIPTTRINLRDIVQGEKHENEDRQPFTPIEAAEIRKAAEPYEREEAEKRLHLSEGRGSKRSGNIPEVKEQSRDKAALPTGYSYKTLDKVDEIVEIAQDNPENEKIQQAVQEMNETGKVETALKLVKKEEARQKLLEEAKNGIKIPNNAIIENRDFFEYSETISDNSIDLIFVDPPYDKETALHVYKRLALEARRILKINGSLITYIGQYALPDILNDILDSGLKYWWILCVKHSGTHAQMFTRKVFVHWKPLLWFVKGDEPMKALDSVADYVLSDPPDKKEHEWEQDTKEAIHFIQKLTVEGQIVLDPFMGSGTTAVAALQLGRKFIGTEIDSDAFQIARKKISNANKKQMHTL